MTVTDMQGAVDSGVTVVPGFTVNASLLRDMLTGALVAVSKEKMGVEALRSVRLEWHERDQHRLTAVATDRYRLVVGTTTDVTAHGDGAALILKDDVAALIKVLPKRATRGRRGLDGVRVSVIADQVMVEGDGWSRSMRLVDAEFPTYRSLLPTDDMLQGVDGDGFRCSPEYLADLAKLPRDTNDSVMLRFQGSQRPAVATLENTIGIDWTYLLMPRRVR